MGNKSENHKKQSEPSTRVLILRGLIFAFLLIAMVSGFLFYREYQAYRQGVDAYASIAETVITSAGAAGSESEIAQAVEQTQAAAEPGGQSDQTSSSASSQPAATLSADQLDYQRIKKVLNIDFDRLKDINPDAVGYILSENTRINYPLVQGRDNSYYLNRLVSNEVNKLGSIFMDYRNQRDFSDGHTLIYGHNMKDGSMFNDLELYKEPSYYPDHKAIYLLTKNQIFRLDIFAAYLTKPQKIGQIYFNFDTKDARETYISEAKRLSKFKSYVVLSEENIIVSLFTCDYATEDSRFVVIGKLVPLNP